MTTPELRALLQELAALRADGEPIVTLYLDTHWNDEQQRERARVYVREAVKRELDAHDAHPQRDALARTLARVTREAEEWVTQSANRNSRAIVVFACEALKLWRVVELNVELPNRLCTGMRPQLLPLARLLEDIEPALVAFVHARGAQIYELALRGVVNEVTVESVTPTLHGAPGGADYASEQKNRHIESFVDRNRRNAAATLVKLFDRDPKGTHVVLCGGPGMVGAFERELPARVSGRVVARLPRPPSKQPKGDGKDGIIAATVEKLIVEERRQEERLVKSVLGLALSGGLGVVGVEDVLLAVNERRVHRLVLEEDFQRTAWLCRNCNALGVSHDEKCTYCNGELAWVKELGEELASRVLLEDGEVEVVSHVPRLHAYEGIAATLRQASVSRGLGLSEATAPQA